MSFVEKIGGKLLLMVGYIFYGIIYKYMFCIESKVFARMFLRSIRVYTYCSLIYSSSVWKRARAALSRAISALHTQARSASGKKRRRSFSPRVEPEKKIRKKRRKRKRRNARVLNRSCGVHDSSHDSRESKRKRLPDKGRETRSSLVDCAGSRCFVHLFSSSSLFLACSLHTGCPKISIHFIPLLSSLPFSRFIAKLVPPPSRIVQTNPFL